MRQYLSSLMLVVLGVACGGSTGTDEPGGAGSSAGGSPTAGSNQGGSGTAGTAGKTSGGSSSGGSSSSGSSSGGNINLAGSGGTSVTAGSGGTGVVNPDCPARVPMGACSADDANVSCQYDPGTGCLCFPTAPGTYLPCQKVDPTCTYMTTPAAAPPAEAGAGGVSAKIGLPAHQVCRCTATTWTCTFGI